MAHSKSTSQKHPHCYFALVERRLDKLSIRNSFVHLSKGYSDGILDPTITNTLTLYGILKRLDRMTLINNPKTQTWLDFYK